MTERNNADAIFPNLSEGPFLVTLHTPHSKGKPENILRYFLGGDEKAETQIDQSIQEINDLPNGLSIDDLRKSAGKIFASHGLLRVDF